MHIRRPIGGRRRVFRRQRLHDLADALADQILKITRLENAQYAVGDVLRQFLLELALEGGREVVGELIDLFGGGENLLRRLCGAGGDRIELVRDACHVLRLQCRVMAGEWVRRGRIGRR